MRLVMSICALPLGGRAHARRYRLSISAIAVSILLSTQSAIALSRATRLISEPETFSVSVPPITYDCYAGKKIPKGKYSDEGLKEGIEEALAILEKCESCRKFYGSFDPIARLKELDKIKAIIMSDLVPTNREQIKGFRDYFRFTTFERMDESDAEVAALSPFKNKYGEMIRPCIYVNPSGVLGNNNPHLGSFASGLTRRQTRAVVILHELAHIAGNIPKDNKNVKDSEWKSLENSRCIRENCFVCAIHPIACVHRPVPKSHPKPEPNSKKKSAKQRKSQ